jgi:RsiW-degrading membrane proteinase PrsW (M82 family)
MLLFYLLPISTAISLYLVWVYRNRIKSPPKAIIIIFCIVLAIIAVAGYFLRDDDFSPESSYTAPHIVEGKIVPAKITPTAE